MLMRRRKKSLSIASACGHNDRMHEWLVIWMQWVADFGYAGVASLMAMESSILPVPSEVVVPPAAVLAAHPGSSMSFLGVVAAGTVGSYVGSCVMYAVALWVGRPFILRFGKWFFMPKGKVVKAELFMQRYSAPGIFFARFLPVVRHLISIPAGLARVNFFTFSIATIVGSSLWCIVLAWFGDKIGREHPDILKSPETLIHAVKDETGLIVGGVLLLAVLYALMLLMTRKKREEPQSRESAD